jgi:hypothetical protein
MSSSYGYGFSNLIVKLEGWFYLASIGELAKKKPIEQEFLV